MFSIEPKTDRGKQLPGSAASQAAWPRCDKPTSAVPVLEQALDLVSEIVDRYRISSLNGLLGSCRAAASQDEIRVAIVGRFKAGKSSFLNHFIGRPIVPVGVVPVTAVITEIRFGPAERAEARFLDGRVEAIPVGEIASYVSERENPENRKRVAIIKVELPYLERFRGLTFVDTPGLESVLAHNTDTSVRWLPNVGLALVAVSVDPPLSRQDIELLKALYRYTPNVSILLTKVDLLAPGERSEVLEFVRIQLTKTFGASPAVVPYSVCTGFEALKSGLESDLVQQTLHEFAEQRDAILTRKIETLLKECSEYIALSLKSAELAGSRRGELKKQAIGEKQVISDLKSELRLIGNHAADGTRTSVATRLDTYQREVENRLTTGLRAEFPSWTKSLAHLLDSFENWLDAALSDELAGVSVAERPKLVERLYDSSRQFRRYLQDFRDRLSERTMQAFGVSLRTTEVEFEIQEPESPDIRIGRVFDRNWELLSPVLPVWLIKRMVRNHFAGKIPHMAYKNLSRLASQWEQAINRALLNMEREAERRLDELMATVEHLIESGSNDRAAEIARDLERVASMRTAISTFGGNKHS